MGSMCRGYTWACCSPLSVGITKTITSTPSITLTSEPRSSGMEWLGKFESVSTYTVDMSYGINIIVVMTVVAVTVLGRISRTWVV